MYVIDIADNQSLLPVDQDRLQRIVTSILQDAGVQQGEISIAVVDDPTIHQLNRQYLDHYYPTDVLSFVLDRDDDVLNGEIIVSGETAIANAKDYDLKPEDELLLYVIHGTLHLIGLDDKTDEGRAEMRAREDVYLKQCDIVRSIKS